MHDLWIFPAPRASRWFARLDWYLNWQMSRGLSHAGFDLPDDINRIADQYGLAVPAAPAVGADLLVLPGPLAPARKCLVLDQGEDPLDRWFARITKRAADLRAQTARVFLPNGITRDDAERAWARLNPPVEAAFETDLEAARW